MKCIGCYYYRSLSQNKYMDDFCCHYLIDTGSMRKIPPSECYRHAGTPYLPKKREPKKFPLAKASAIMRLPYPLKLFQL